VCPEAPPRSHVSRAPRYPIHTPVLFRESGGEEWYEGTTVNISRTGVLFQTDVNLLPRTLLEMRIALPPEVTEDTQANVLCWGPVVRLGPIIEKEGRPTLAAAILRYRFSHD
jgi:hypothetical protein